MAASYEELAAFYAALLETARAQEVACAITSGMACVAFGVSQTTRDCDILLAPSGSEAVLETLMASRFRSAEPSYSGSLSAPLDRRWLQGGWTAHFVWTNGPDSAYLDVFGRPPRSSGPWQSEVKGLYAGENTVAERKRTDRPRDWPFATALGLRLLREGDERGWHHLFDEEVILQVLEESKIPAEILRARPVLQLAEKQDKRLRPALLTEIQFWQEMDKLRLQIFQRAVRPYAAAVRAESQPAGLAQQHVVRVGLAENLLPPLPLDDYGTEAMIRDATERVGQLVRPELLEWLPDVRSFFTMKGS